MKSLRPQPSPFRPVSFQTAGVALWLVFLLATHAFWCGLSGAACESDGAPGGEARAMSATHAVAAVTMVVTHSHSATDVCAGVDETKARAFAAAPLVAPALIWIALVWVVAASVAVALWQRAAVFGRDGPVCVPPLRGRLVRASLPHRAPPVFLI